MKTSCVSALYRRDRWTKNTPETSLHMYKIDSISSSKPSIVVSRQEGVDECGVPISHHDAKLESHL